MNKIKVIGLGLFFSLFFVACGGSSSSSPTPDGDRDGGGELGSQTLSASPESLSFTYGETNFKISQVTSNKAGTGKYSVTSNDESVAEVYINSVGLVRVTPISVGNAIITVTRERDSSYDSASQTIEISVNKQEQNLKVNLGTTTSNRWKLSKDATATISVAAKSVGGVGGDGVLVGSGTAYSVKSSDTGVVAVEMGSAGEITIKAESIGDATVTVSNGGGDNYNKGNVVIFITVNADATQAALNSSATDVTFDGYSTTKNITVTGGTIGDVDVTSSHPDVVTVPTGIVSNGEITITPLSAGTAVITVTRKGGVSSDGVTTYNPISKDIRVTVNKPAAQTLIADPSRFLATYDKGVDTTSSTVSNTNSTGTGNYYIESSKSDVATASIDALGEITVLFEQVGTTDIIITRAGDYRYRSSIAAIIDVTVDKADQTLSVIPSSSSISATYVEDGGATSIDITGGKGTGSFYEPSSDDETVATASIKESGELTIALKQAGTTNITVLKRGDRNYKDSNSLKILVTIDQASQIISIEGNETTFQQQRGSDPVTVAILGAKGDGDYTIDSNDNPAVASADFNNNNLTLTLGVVGTANIEFRKNGDRNYEDSNVIPITVEVTTQANQAITTTTSEFTALYADEIPTQTTDISITPSGASDADGEYYPVTSSSVDVATATINNETNLLTVTFHNAGEATLFVRRQAVTGFNASRTLGIKVTVAKASQTIAIAEGYQDKFELSYGEATSTKVTGAKVASSYAIFSAPEDKSVVDVEQRGNNSDEFFIEAIGTGTTTFKVINHGNNNYKRSNTLTINVTVNRAAQKLTARPSAFNLAYNKTAMSTITTDAVYFADEGDYVVSNNDTNIVTTDIDQENGVLSLSLRAVGVGDATITISKQQDNRYLKSAEIKIPIRVIKADQELTSNIPSSVFFDKPTDSTTAIISGGFSSVAYTATSNNTAIVTAVITAAGSLTIAAIASGDATVTVQRAGDANYNAAADLTIEVRVKTQQTLSVAGTPVSSFEFKYQQRQSVATITGGQGIGGYQASYTLTGIVTTDVDARVLFITTVSTGDTIVTIYKEGDDRYNQSDPILLSVSVTRGVVTLAYERTTIEYLASATISPKALSAGPSIIPGTVFVYDYTTSDNIAANGGAKIGVSLNEFGIVTVNALNADDATAIITVTRAQTPYYEQAVADASVRVIRATLAITYGDPRDGGTVVSGATLNFDYNEATAVFNIIDGPQGVSYELTPANNSNAAIAPDGSLTVTPLSVGRISQTITRAATNNYNSQTFDFTIDVERATSELGYNSPSGELYLGGPAVTAGITTATPTSNRGHSGTFGYSATAVDTDASIIVSIDENTGELTLIPDAVGRVTITVDREENANYLESTVTRIYRVKDSQILEYNDFTVDLEGGAQTIQPSSSTRLSSSTPVATVSESTPSTLASNIVGLLIADGGALTITPSGEVTGDVTIRITNATDDDYGPLNTTVDFRVRILPLVISSRTQGYSSAYNGKTANNVALDYTGIVETTLELSKAIDPALSFRASSSNEATADVTVDAQTRRLTITAEGEGEVIVTVTADNGANSAVLKLSVTVSNLQLTHTASTDVDLGGRGGGLTTALVDATTYLFIAGQSISSREVSADGSFESASTTTTSGDSVVASVINDQTYIFTADRDTSIISVHSFTDGTLSSAAIDSKDHADNPDYNIRGASALTIATIEDKFYLFVASSISDGVSVFEVAADTGLLTYKTSTTDKGNFNLNGANSVVTALVDATTYLFVGGGDDNGISGFKVKVLDGGDVTLVHVFDKQIAQVSDLTTVTTDEGTFLFVASFFGVSSAARIMTDGKLATINSAFITDESFAFLATAKIGGRNFLFTAANDKVFAREVQDNGDFSLRGSGVVVISDTPNYAIKKASSLTTAVIGGKLFLFVAGSDDNGVSVFEVK